jgi:hypothetical protein
MDAYNCWAVTGLAMKSLMPASPLVSWASLQPELSASGGGNERVPAFIASRLARLRQSCPEAGLDPRGVDSFLASLGDDPANQPTIAAIAREATWGLVEIMLEAHRRWDEFDADSPSARSLVLQWMGRTEQALAQRLFASLTRAGPGTGRSHQLRGAAGEKCVAAIRSLFSRLWPRIRARNAGSVPRRWCHARTA